jgi:hypothetical protein
VIADPSVNAESHTRLIARQFAALLLSCLLAQACGSAGGGASTDGGGAGAAGADDSARDKSSAGDAITEDLGSVNLTPKTPEEFLASLRELACGAAAARCCTNIGIPFRTDACKAATANPPPNSVGATFNPNLARDCLARADLTLRTCTYAPLFLLCDRAFCPANQTCEDSGTFGAGDLCFHDLCRPVGDLVCRSDTHMCEPPSPRGGACHSAGDCKEPGADCRNDRCVLPAKAGEACIPNVSDSLSGPASCAEGLVCLNNTCVSAPRAGEPCAAVFPRCDSRSLCVNSYCRRNWEDYCQYPSDI